VKTALGRDAALIYAAAFLRSATVGLVGVVLAIYLSDAGLSAAAIGVVIGSGLAGAAAATMLLGFRGDVFGRRRALIALTVLAAIGYIGISWSSRFVVLLPVAFVGMLNGMGRDRGAASVLDQAILPETTTAERRTWVLAWYNVVLDAGHAIGALAGATPTLLIRAFQVEASAAHRVTFLICGGLTLVSVVPYLALTPRIEVADPDRVAGSKETGPTRDGAGPSGPATSSRSKTVRLNADSKHAVTKLALLFGLDSVGGGFLNSALIAYWFFQRYGTAESLLAVLFFTARALNAASHIMAAWMARRIGLVNTMVLTHLPSSLFVMAAPAAPTAAIAATLFLCREALVEMDVPTRQSYVMAIVRPPERTFASSVTNMTRNVGWAAGPSLAGVVMERVALAAPLFIGGTLKIGYDLLLYLSFRHFKPPEEESFRARRPR
jgi:MFS family permease